ncbi:hypothetical protein EDD85DRAFT_790460 [Armillaria nabsnona]|nr:hypothetical protein EDD85DRAFT_790460 [Armillaria nabsnona]
MFGIFLRVINTGGRLVSSSPPIIPGCSGAFIASAKGFCSPDPWSRIQIRRPPSKPSEVWLVLHVLGLKIRSLRDCGENISHVQSRESQKSYANWSWRTATGDQADVDWTPLAYQDTKVPDISPFSTLIIKDSWLIKDKPAAEAGQSMFRGVSCCFGVSEVLAAYEVKDCRGAPITMRRLSSASFGRNSIDRVLHREIIKTEGKDLREAATVQILLRAILHAMLGLYSRYLYGWIHGDVNTSSVLLLAQPEMRGSLGAWNAWDVILHVDSSSTILITSDATGDILMMAEDKTEYTVHLHRTVLPLGPSISSITPLVEKWYALASTYQGKVKCLLAGISPSSDLSQQMVVLWQLMDHIPESKEPKSWIGYLRRYFSPQYPESLIAKEPPSTV